MGKNADRKKYHVIYKTTCEVTSRYYIGMHSTDDLNDGYIGSGKSLWWSIRRHGRENHKFEILEHLSDRKSLREREAQIVDAERLKDLTCLNLKEGGEGGWHLTSEQIQARNAKCNQRLVEKLRTDPELRKKFGRLALKNVEQHRRAWNETYDWSGKRHSETTKQLMSQLHRGERNSQHGTMWITNGLESRKIKTDQPMPEGWRKGRCLQKPSSMIN